MPGSGAMPERTCLKSGWQISTRSAEAAGTVSLPMVFKVPCPVEFVGGPSKKPLGPLPAGLTLFPE